MDTESHIDRSIDNSVEYAKTNVPRTLTLLDQTKHSSQDDIRKLFYYISIDQVYGLFRANGLFTNNTSDDSKPPLLAAITSPDHFVGAYHNTFGFPVVIVNFSNNLRSIQFPEN